MRIISILSLIAFALPLSAQRPRLRDLGVSIGILAPGPLNAITDVEGVRVGQVTLIRGDNVRTGVTVVLPHAGNLFQDKVAGAIFVGNGFGKITGMTQVDELGEIETPIVLTSTLNVPRVADALLDYMLALPGNENVRSINPLIAETNDGILNDARSRPVSRAEVFEAIRSAAGGAVAEGSVGAGTGTIAFGFKGGIGSASRRLPTKLGGYTVGVLAQTNFGGILTIAGAPVGRELGRYYLKDELTKADGSCVMVIATDAPVDAHNLKRIGARAIMGMARTGAAGGNGSGDYAIAFTTYRREGPRLSNDAMSPLFLAAIEATEEAILNSLFRATTTAGNGHTIEALPIEAVEEILRRYGVLR